MVVAKEERLMMIYVPAVVLAGQAALYTYSAMGYRSMFLALLAALNWVGFACLLLWLTKREEEPRDE